MPTIKDIAQELESWAPLSAAESYDNVGLLVGIPGAEVTGVLINLDMTEDVVEEAIERGCNLIVAHHPIWFGARSRLNGEDYVSRTIIAAIKNDIGLYACHTNLDNVRTGVNHKICELMGLQNVGFLLAKDAEKKYGSGMIGMLKAPMVKADFLAFVKENFGCGVIRYADCDLEKIQKIAICGGSGSFLTGAALAAGADALVTGDITYHNFFDNESRLLLMDIGHYESEQFTSQLIHDFLSEKFRNFALHLSKRITNPVKYF